MIRNALKEAFAERIFACLDRFSAWKAYEDYSQKHFHYRHHNVYDVAPYAQAKRLAVSGWCTGKAETSDRGSRDRDEASPRLPLIEAI